MKRCGSILVLLGLAVAITYLAVERHFAQERADRLDRALQEAEARMAHLEAEIESFQTQVSELKRARESVGSVSLTSRSSSARLVATTASSTALVAPSQAGLATGSAGS